MEKLKLSDPMFYKYLFLLNTTGVRHGDILRLKYGNTDLNNEEIRIKIQKISLEVIFPLYKT
jgi:integrase